jgi:branched-chain amino acid aminotransferase
VIQIAADLGYTVVERDVARAELYLAEEVFLTGTAASSSRSRDRRPRPRRAGEITRVIQGKFDDALHGGRGVPRVARPVGSRPARPP